MVKRMLGGTETDPPRAGGCNVCGIVFLLAVLLAFPGLAWYAGSAVKQVISRGDAESRLGRMRDDVGRERRGGGNGEGRGQISGSMSLGNIRAATGVTADTLKSDLGLPSDVSDQERVGRLSRRHGFNVAQIRDIVAKRVSKPGE